MNMPLSIVPIVCVLAHTGHLACATLSVALLAAAWVVS